MKKLALTISTVILIVVLSGCGPIASPTPTPTPPPATEVTLAMGYIPNVQFAPFYVAVEKGYFAQENLTINFDYGMESDLIKLVGTDKLQFVIGSGEQVILARAQGLPVVYVMNWYRRFPVCVVSLQEKGIERPEELVGKRVGIPAMYGASYIGWRALLYVEGIDETEVNLETIGYTQVSSLTEDQVDAAIGYAMNEPVQLRQMGREINVIYVADYIDLVSNGIITNEKTIQEKPDLVQGLVRASLRGLRYTIEHPEEAFEVVLKYVPEAGGENKPAQLAVLEESIKFWRSDQLGYSDPAAWQTSQRFLRQIGLVDAETDVSRMFTNRFIVEP